MWYGLGNNVKRRRNLNMFPPCSVFNLLYSACADSVILGNFTCCPLVRSNDRNITIFKFCIAMILSFCKTPTFFIVAISHIISMCSKKKMIVINTLRGIASMAYFHFIRNAKLCFFFINQSAYKFFLSMYSYFWIRICTAFVTCANMTTVFIDKIFDFFSMCKGLPISPLKIAFGIFWYRHKHSFKKYPACNEVREEASQFNGLTDRICCFQSFADSIKNICFSVLCVNRYEI